MHNSFHILCIFILSSCKTSQFERRILIPPWPDHRVPTWNPSRWRRALPHREDRFLDVAYYSRTTCCGSLSSSTRRRHRYTEGLSRHSGLLRCAVPYTETPLGPEMPAVGNAICRLFRDLRPLPLALGTNARVTRRSVRCTFHILSTPRTSCPSVQFLHAEQIGVEYRSGLDISCHSLRVRFASPPSLGPGGMNHSMFPVFSRIHCSS